MNLVSFAASDKKLVSGGSGSVIVWDSQTGEKEFSYKSSGFFCVSRDTSSLVVCEENKLRIVDLLNGKVKQTIPNIHRVQLSGVELDPSGKFVATLGNHNKSLKLHRLADSTEAWVFEPLDRKFNCFSFSPDGTKLAAGCEDGSFTLLDVKTGFELWRLKEHRLPIQDICFGPDGIHLTTASGLELSDTAGQIKVWNVITEEEVKSKKGHLASINSICFSQNGRRLCSGGDDRTVKVWDLTTGNELRSTRNNNGTAVVSSDGSLVASFNKSSSRMQVSDSISGRSVTEFEIANPLQFGFNSAGTQVFSNDYLGVFQIWDAKTGRKKRTLAGTVAWFKPFRMQGKDGD